ncbi:conserved hypothetical protein, partial [Ricinus communis]
VRLHAGRAQRRAVQLRFGEENDCVVAVVGSFGPDELPREVRDVTCVSSVAHADGLPEVGLIVHAADGEGQAFGRLAREPGGGCSGGAKNAGMAHFHVDSCVDVQKRNVL